jgi:hypothetical protein
VVSQSDRSTYRHRFCGDTVVQPGRMGRRVLEMDVRVPRNAASLDRHSARRRVTVQAGAEKRSFNRTKKLRAVSVPSILE